MLNKNEFTFLGINRFHEEGYTGKNIKIASKEWVHKSYFPNVTSLNLLDGEERCHGDLVMDYINQVAPDAKKISVRVRGKLKAEEEQYLRKNIPDIITCSQFAGKEDVDEQRISLWKFLNENDCFLCCASGNEDEEKVPLLGRTDYWKTIGSCHYPQLEKALYSNYGKYLDFMSLSNLRSSLDGKVKHQGTSFASPIFARNDCTSSRFLYRKCR